MILPKPIQEGLQLLPTGPGVYLMYDAAGEILYVGKAVNLRNRVRSYFREDGGHSPRTRLMIPHITRFEWISTSTEVEALVLENVLIKRHRPYNNILLKDDKGYPFLKITDEEYPRLVVARQRLHDKGRYYGPFPDIGLMHSMKDVLTEIYPLKTCQKPRFRNRPCINYQIHRCLGPCHHQVTRAEYLALVDEVSKVLEGKAKGLLEIIDRHMQDACEKLDFERAARLRDARRGIERMSQKQKVVGDPATEEDIIGIACQDTLTCIQLFQVREGKLLNRISFELDGAGESPEIILEAFLVQYYSRDTEVPKEVVVPIQLDNAEAITEFLGLRRHGRVRLICPQRGDRQALIEMAHQNAEENLKRALVVRSQDEEALTELASICESGPLRRIECYDISNIQGSDTVASMVVFLDGQPAKGDYRRFKIRREGIDDFASMEEVLTRRFQRLIKDGGMPPSLVIVDGGKGQVSAAKDVLKRLNIQVPMVGLAKRFEELCFPDGHTVRPQGSALYLLQRIRDEAHRFAITYHRTLRGKRMIHSLLDEIPGIGEARKKKLLEVFGSVEDMRQASVSDLVRAGLPRNTAEILSRRLQGE